MYYALELWRRKVLPTMTPTHPVYAVQLQPPNSQWWFYDPAGKTFAHTDKGLEEAKTWAHFLTDPDSSAEYEGWHARVILFHYKVMETIN